MVIIYRLLNLKILFKYDTHIHAQTCMQYIYVHINTYVRYTRDICGRICKKLYNLCLLCGIEKVI